MDRLSSPTAIASPATVRSTSSTQTTYTTAGTVYKPNSTQPLQPPARRGRSFKWANGGLHTELSLLPKSVLATLPLRGVSRATVMQQYSPLQQNYDRAISPGLLFEGDHASAKMVQQGPATGRTDDSSVLSSLFAGSSDDRATSQFGDSDTEESEDEDVGMDPLAGMPFKSLQNLASYPNPMQLKARKAVNVAKPFPQVSDQKYCAPNTAYLRPIGSPPKSIQRNDEREDPALNPQQGLRNGQRLLETKPGPTTLANSPGTPRPLTAGPPGQRQYRPATFEATWKALQTKAQQKTDDETKLSEVDTPWYSQSLGWDQWSQYRPSPVPRVDSVMDFMSMEDDITTARSAKWSATQPQLSGLSTPVYPVSLDSTALVPGKDQAILENPKLKMLARFQPGTDRLAEDEIKAKDELNNCAWNTGHGLMNKSTTEAIADARSRRFEQTHGVIGDGRPSKKAVVYPPMSIDEANALSTASHAKPLLDLAFDTLLRHRDENIKKAS